MSEEPKTGKERRSIISTLFDPKTIPTLIPVMIAVAGAFLALDRMVHRISITQEQHAEDIDRNYDYAKELQDKYAQVSVLQSKLNDIDSEAEELEELQKELEKLVQEINHLVGVGKNRMDGLETRIHLIEQRINQLIK